MNALVIILIILLVLLGIVAARIVFEVTHPQISRYSFKTKKLSYNEKVRILFLSDLHSRKYGSNNIRLIRMISRTRPDFIVLGGDMITASRLMNRDALTINTLDAMTDIAPVYYAPGNHEKSLSENEKQRERYEDFRFELECMDVTYLENQKAIMTEDLFVYGLDIDSKYYRKFGQKPQMTPEYISSRLGVPDKNKYNILLAHTPEFFDTYAQAGYDLVLCGHYHGGTINMPWTGPLISPDLKFKPEHCGGAYKKNGTIIVVTRGIGSHTINIRLLNRTEIVVLDLKQED